MILKAPYSNIIVVAYCGSWVFFRCLIRSHLLSKVQHSENSMVELSISQQQPYIPTNSSPMNRYPTCVGLVLIGENSLDSFSSSDLLINGVTNDTTVICAPAWNIKVWDYLGHCTGLLGRVQKDSIAMSVIVDH